MAFRYGTDAADRIIGPNQPNADWAGAYYASGRRYTKSESGGLFGYNGNDTIFGGDFTDHVEGGSGDDRIFGRGGNDAESSDLKQEDRNYDSSDVEYHGGLRGGGGNDVIDGGSGSDYLAGEADNDTLKGAAGDDCVHRFRADEIVDDRKLNAAQGGLYGGGGIDKLYGGAGTDFLSGGEGDDTLIGGADDDAAITDLDKRTGSIREISISYAGGLEGGAGKDFIDGGNGTDLLRGGDGDDTLKGGDADDAASHYEIHHVTHRNVDVTAGLFGDAGNDLLDGGGGRDSLSGGDGDDTLKGGRGDDSGYSYKTDLFHRITTRSGGLSGDAGDDRIYGGDGVDLLLGGSGNDTLFGGEGDDRGFLDESLSINTYSLLTVDAGLLGGQGNDVLYGEAGADILAGDAGNDTVSGGAGSDRLSGGTGRDMLVGGSDADLFVFEAAAAASSRDVITDFSVEVDQIHLAGIDADSGAAGDQAFTWRATAGFSGVAGEAYFRAAADDTCVYLDMDGDRHADYSIRLQGVHSLSIADFIL